MFAYYDTTFKDILNLALPENKRTAISNMMTILNKKKIAESSRFVNELQPNFSLDLPTYGQCVIKKFKRNRLIRSRVNRT
jgi:hypothetical protein